MPTAYGVLGTYPPTQCGIATFSAALVEALRGPDADVEVVALVDEPQHFFPPEVAHQWVRGRPGGAVTAAAHLSRNDIVIVQHEYGIFGGQDGRDVLDVVSAMTVPVIAVLHTVLVAPTVNQRRILFDLARASDVVVTMTWTARKRLIDMYGIDPRTVVVIPHGAAGTPASRSTSKVPVTGHPPVILTWGLLGDGKGIEWGVEALAGLRDLKPTPRYHIVGQTHPKVLEREGEAYRSRLIRAARKHGVEDLVFFDDRYLTTADLNALVSEADIVLLPYDSLDQVTSGVLVEAVTAMKPVISTPFPHAVELLSAGLGILVERKSPRAIADAVRLLVTQPAVASGMARAAADVAPDLLWPAVAERYRLLGDSLVANVRMPVSA